jgi:hypothetical protein
MNWPIRSSKSLPFTRAQVSKENMPTSSSEGGKSDPEDHPVEPPTPKKNPEPEKKIDRKPTSPWLDPRVLLTFFGMILAGCAVFFKFQSDVQRLDLEYADRKDFDTRLDDRLTKLTDRVNDLQRPIDSAARDLKEAKETHEQSGKAIDDAKKGLDRVDDIVREAKTQLESYVKALEERASTSMLEQMPLGSILMWPSKEKPPDKWRICNGDVITPNEAPDFCNRFKDYFWSSEKGSIIRLPDLRGYFIRGADDRLEKKIDEDGPRFVGSVEPEKFPEHSHDSSTLRVAGGLMANNQFMFLYLHGPWNDSLQGDWRTFLGSRRWRERYGSKARWVYGCRNDSVAWRNW